MGVHSLSYFSLSFPLFSTTCAYGDEGGYNSTVTLGGSVVAEKRCFVFCCHDIQVECRNDETKKKA